MNPPDLSLLPFNQLLQDLLLPANDHTELGVDDLGVELAAHQRGTFVVFDVALVDGFCQFDVLAEALLLEVADGKLVGKGEKVQDSVADVIVLEKF